jgi:hypothetical protein
LHLLIDSQAHLVVEFSGNTLGLHKLIDDRHDMGDGTFYDIIIQQNGEQLELKVGLIKKMFCANDKKMHQKHRINKNSLKVF